MPNYFNPYQQQNPYSGYNPQLLQQQQPRYDFLPAPSEEYARTYPVAPGNSINFKDENAPYIYTKTMGSSPLNQPIFEKYKLIKEEDAPIKQNSAQISDEKFSEINNTFDELKSQIEQLWSEIEALKIKKSTTTKKKDNGDE